MLNNKIVILKCYTNYNTLSKKMCDSNTLMVILSLNILYLWMNEVSCLVPLVFHILSVARAIVSTILAHFDKVISIDCYYSDALI